MAKKLCNHFNLHINIVQHCLQMLNVDLYLLIPIFVSIAQFHQTSVHLVTAALRFQKTFICFTRE